jgi:hypothetical protein
MSPRGNVRHMKGPHRPWCVLVIVLAILALTVSLATRTSTPTVSHNIGVQAQSSQVTRQHLDTDAAQWVSPVAPVVVSEVVSFYPRVSPAGPPVPNLFFEQSLYNRPPPCC